jgi:hypothetical protein
MIIAHGSNGEVENSLMKGWIAQIYTSNRISLSGTGRIS